MRTSFSLASTMAGGPSPFSEIAPIQLHLPAGTFGTGSGEKLIAVSAGAVVNVGDSIFKKWVNGWASSPGGGLIALRSRRYSNTRTSTFRRSEEHTSELQSQSNLVCRLLLEKKKKIK